ncbi:MAG: glycosyltransferase [Candidatus Carbobacillus altaicus]|nr:glycosyltransferase [Candidatus Carbobacillus altaicus]
MGKTVRITHIIGGGEFGGAEMHLIKLFHSLKDTFDLRLVTIYNGELAQKMREAGYPVNVLSQTGRFDLSLYRQLTRLFKSSPPHLVHTHGVRANFFGRLAARRLGLPTVTTVHSFLKQDYPLRREYWMAYVMEHLTRPLVQHFITVSHALKEALQREHIPDNKITVIPNAIDTSVFLSGDARLNKRKALREQLGIGDERVIVSTSRLVPVKGLDVLLQAFAGLKKHQGDVKLVLIGAGIEKKELMALSRALEIEENVLFLGYRRDIPELLTIADLYVLPSRMEGGFPLSLMESLASGIPSIATALPAILEWVDERVETRTKAPFYLVPPDDAERLKQALLDLLHHPNKRAQLAEQGKTFVQTTFSMERLADDTRALYEKLVNRSR